MKTTTTYKDLIQDLIDNKITMVGSNEFKTILKHYSKIYEGDNLYGHLDFQREISSNHIDYYIMFCPDMYFGEYLIPYLIESAYLHQLNPTYS